MASNISIYVIFLIVSFTAVSSQQNSNLAATSSRFARLQGNRNTNAQPVVIRLEPNRELTRTDFEEASRIQQQLGAPQANAQQTIGIPSNIVDPALSPIRRPPQLRPSIATGPLDAFIAPLNNEQRVPQQRAPTAAPVQPPQAQLPQIPPQLAQLLGIQNLGIPGLIGSPAGAPAAQSPAQALGLPAALNGFSAEQLADLARQNPELARQFLQNSGLLNQQQAQIPSNPTFGLNPTPNQGIQNFVSGTSSVFGGNPGIPGVPTNQGGANPANGLLGVFTRLTQQLTQNSGISSLIEQTAQGQGPNLASLLTEQGTSGGVPNPFGSNPRVPPAVGLPRIPGVPLLPGGIPKDASGGVDMVQLMSQITRRVTNGTTLSDVLPPSQLQSFADNITNTLLPKTPDVDLTKFMGRWFEGIHSPKSSPHRCTVHHYGGLTENKKTATFTALKIYREGSEFGKVRYSIGYAFRGGHTDGMLNMHSSETADASPYWIYKVGPEAEDAFGNLQYDYAIVSNWVKYPVTVLVRDPDSFKKNHAETVLRYLEDEGFINGFIRAFNMLQPVSYTNCQYSDSTFQVFGR